MKLFSTLTLAALALSSSVFAAPLAFSKKDLHRRQTGSPVGFASTNGGTTGGAGGSETTVTTLKELTAAVKGDKAKVVYVDGLIKGDQKTIKVGANTSILSKNGNGKDGLTAGGLMIKEAENVIIQGLAFSLAKAPTDLVAIQESTNVWVDHCSFTSSLEVDKDYYDGQLDITHAGDFVTVSWCEFADAYKTSLIGHSDSNKAEDTGHLRVTYHHNFFHKVNSRLPSLRFGTLHAFNNFYKDVTGSGINSRLGAQALIENNSFDTVKKPIQTTLKDGYAVALGNVFVNSDEPDLENVGSISAGDLGYSYELDAADDVASIVAAGAGPSGL